MRRRARRRSGFFARLRRDERGVAAIEFAMTVPILLVAMLGIIEFGRVLWTQNALHYAVEQAARCASIDTTTCSSSGTTQSFASTASGITFPPAVFAVSSQPCGNQVIATYSFPFLTSLVSYNLTLSAQSCFPS
jgi:Flp pilus assembly pilin Flp